MFIIKTVYGNVNADFDEVQRVLTAGLEELVVLRQGIVKPKYIATIVEDPDARSTIMRLPGESDIDVQKRIEAYRSDDAFSYLKRPALPEGAVTKQLHDGQG